MLKIAGFIAGFFVASYLVQFIYALHWVRPFPGPAAGTICVMLIGLSACAAHWAAGRFLGGAQSFIQIGAFCVVGGFVRMLFEVVSSEDGSIPDASLLDIVVAYSPLWLIWGLVSLFIWCRERRAK